MEQASSAAVGLGEEIDHVASLTEIILSRTLLSPSLEDVTNGRVEHQGGTLERAEYRQKRTSIAALQHGRQNWQSGGLSQQQVLPQLGSRTPEHRLLTAREDGPEQMQASVSQLLNRLRFTQENNRDEAGLEDLSEIAAEAFQLLSRSQNSAKRSIIPTIRSRIRDDDRIQQVCGSPQSSRISIDRQSIFSEGTLDTALTSPTITARPDTRASTAIERSSSFGMGLGFQLSDPAISTLLYGKAAKLLVCPSRDRPVTVTNTVSYFKSNT